MMKELLPPADKVCEGYVFTGVCLSIGGDLLRGGRVCILGGRVCIRRVLDRPPPTPHPHRILQDTVNQRAVGILLVFILVY